MDTIQESVVPGSAAADLEMIIDHLITGLPLDAELLRRVEERGERLGQETLQRHGLLNVAVDLVREARDEE